MLINRSRLKEIAGNLQLTAGFCEDLDKEVENMVIKSCKRATANKRNTLMKRDV